MFSHLDARPTPDFAALPARLSPAAGGWLAALRRGLDVVVAFATLRDAEASDGALTARVGGDAGPGPPHRPRQRPATTAARASHAHRRRLRAPSRSRRPGAVPAPPHACITPLTTSRAARRPNRTAPRV
jgi:hypothetical protein